jgi:hypothetical protein
MHSPIRYLVSITLIIVCLIFLSRQISSFSSLIDIELDDFVEYWSASVLHLQGRNPYDRELLTVLQNSAGRFQDVPVMMWNPPWTLGLLIPFGLLDFFPARILWFFTHFLVLLTGSGFLWQYFGGQKRFLWVAWLVALTFGPTLMMLKAGQISSLFLLGVVGFLYFERRGNDFLAGLSASLVMVKPHVAYLFILITIFWALHTRKWRFLAGNLFFIAVASLVVYVINPSTMTDYLFATSNYPPVAWATPTLGGIARFYLGEEKFWLQFIAPTLGLFWGLVYYASRTGKWVWSNEISLICLVSISTAAYGWLFDQVLLVCALLQIAVWFGHSKYHVKKLLLLSVYLPLNYYVSFSQVNQFWFFWLSPLLLLLFLFARHSISPKKIELNDSIIPPSKIEYLT